MKIEWLNAAGGLQTDDAWNDPGVLAPLARVWQRRFAGED
jgi:hypothetical protein